MTDLVETMQQEISERLNELRPAVAEAKQLEAAAAVLEEVPGTASIARTSAAAAPAIEVPVKASPVRRPRRRAKVGRKAGSPRRKRAALSKNQRAILAALEHGAHTVRELVIVTGMSDQTVRNNLKGLLGGEMVVKTDRGGKAAYALPAAVQKLAAAA